MSTKAPHLPLQAGTPNPSRWLGTFWALLGRDATVLRANFGEFAGQIITQPLLLVFVFTYLLPKTGIDLRATREIDDPAGAPIPLWLIALEKIAFGAWQALLAGLLVFPLAYLLPMGTTRPRPLGAGHGARQPARVPQRSDARGAHSHGHTHGTARLPRRQLRDSRAPTHTRDPSVHAPDATVVRPYGRLGASIGSDGTGARRAISRSARAHPA